jgi:hypothetical protein
MQITTEPREKAPKQEATDIEIGVTCTIEETLGEEKSELEASKLQVYVWQIPFMLLTISIILFVVGLNIWVFEAATREVTWGDDRKVQIPFLRFSNVLLLSALCEACAWLYELTRCVGGMSLGRSVFWCHGSFCGGKLFDQLRD